MTQREKKQLVAKVIKKFVQNGYEITGFIGKPLSHFDEEKLKIILENENF